MDDKNINYDRHETTANGLILKGIGGFYYVDIGKKIIRAKGSGALKKNVGKLYVGDEVVLGIRDDGDSVIEEIHARKNIFIRPPIANVDKMIIVSSCTNPSVNFQIVDRFIIATNSNNVTPILCFNKVDLVDEDFVTKITNIYGKHYKVIFTSAHNEEGLDDIKQEIKGCKVAFAGASGVGKSTIISKIIGEDIEIGSISEKTMRGKHTTRHVEIFPKFGGYVYDTPGFTSFDILDIDDKLDLYYPEFMMHKESCRFDNCNHINEPECAILDALSQGKISQERYESYTINLQELLTKAKKEKITKKRNAKVISSKKGKR